MESFKSESRSLWSHYHFEDPNREDLNQDKVVWFGAFQLCFLSQDLACLEKVELSLVFLHCRSQSAVLEKCVCNSKGAPHVQLELELQFISDCALGWCGISWTPETRGNLGLLLCANGQVLLVPVSVQLERQGVLFLLNCLRWRLPAEEWDSWEAGRGEMVGSAFLHWWGCAPVLGWAVCSKGIMGAFLFGLGCASVKTSRTEFQEGAPLEGLQKIRQHWAAGVPHSQQVWELDCW